MGLFPTRAFSDMAFYTDVLPNISCAIVEDLYFFTIFAGKF